MSTPDPAAIAARTTEILATWQQDADDLAEAERNVTPVQRTERNGVK